MRRPLALLALAALLLSVAPPFAGADGKKEPTRGLRFPSLTPDGKTVVFAYRGDIWRASVEGGTPVRLTVHEAQDTKPRVSPDGRWIAFSSKRTGNYDVFVMPIDGGEPRQVTWHSAADIATDWSSDGKKILFFSGRDPDGFGTEIYEIPVEGGTPRRATTGGGRDGAYSPDGTSVVYARGWNVPFQDEYRGSANFDLWVQPLAGGAPRRVTKTDRNEMNPCWSADGRTIWFLAEDEKGVFQVWSIPAQGGEAVQVTHDTVADLRRPVLSWDRKTLAVERDARLVTVDLSSPEPEAVALEIRVDADVRNAGTDVRTITAGPEHASVSPDGSQVAASVNGDLWLLPSVGGEAIRLTSTPATEDWPRWSPDGRRLVYFSDEKGNQDVFTLDLSTHERKAVTSNAADDSFPSFAPDGRHVVFTSNRAGNKDLWTADLDTGEEKALTRDPKDDDDATCSADGRWIAFDSGRGGSQGIWVMPASGPESAAKRVAGGTAFFQCPTFSPDGQMLAFEQMDPATGQSGGLFVAKATGGDAVPLSKDGSTACWSPRGDWIYFSAERGGEKNLFRVRAPQSVEGGEKVPFLGRVVVDRRKEYADLFDEAWKKLKDGFYDPRMHGVDWDAMKAKYRPLAEDAEVKDEFYNVVSQMLSELKASHLGIFEGGPDEEDGLPDSKPTGYLGLEWDGAPVEGGGRRVLSVLQKGPADEAGIRAGDVVKTIGGRKVDAGTDVDRLLSGVAGRDVQIAYAKGDGSGDATQVLKAASWGSLNAMRSARWVETCRKAVLDGTKGAAGYVHLEQMNAANLAKFQEALQRFDADKKVKGLVLDVRNNGGGNIHQQLVEALCARPFAQIQARGQPRQTQPGTSWGKPVVLLVNERSFSDAEVFPFAFKALHLGKIVGVPTAGGVIGTNDVTLSDGSRFRIPRVGYYGMDGTNLEHLGVQPDVVVEETAEDLAAHRDPQLLKAIEVILSEIGGAKGGSPAPEGTPASAGPSAAGSGGEGGSGVPKDVVNPLFDAKAGEWVKYKVLLPSGEEAEATVKVTEVTETEVALDQEMKGPDGKVVPAGTSQRREKRTKNLVWGEDEGTVEGSETLVVNGVSLKCAIVSVPTKSGAVEKRWITNDVPVGGTVKRERDGRVVSELVAWGTEAPPKQ